MSMKIFDLYLFKNLLIATLFIGVTLAVVVFLTQSLRFLELVINAGASSSAFWILTLLALPRFFEVILPLAVMAATLFIYNRMAMDSELTAIRAVGCSPLALARPALVLALLMTVLLWVMTMWVAPASLSSMQQMRQVIKAQISSLLFREGVFNAAGPGLTVYLRSRSAEGELHGLMIHDSRDETTSPSTILAKRGVVVNDEDGHKVVVYDGSRQAFDRRSGTLQRLNFERYTIDLPESSPVRQRWREPEERTILELLTPDPESRRDAENAREFHIEIHRRVVSPLLAFVFTAIALAALLVGPADRRGQGRRIALAIVSVIAIQGLFLAAFNLSKHSNAGFILMYALVLAPPAASLFLLSPRGEGLRRRLLYTAGRKAVLP